VNAYASVDQLKSTAILNLSTGTVYDAPLRVLLENVSREIDRQVKRSFYSVVDTKYFSGDGSTSMLLPDVVALDTVNESTLMDGTWNSTYASTDYWLHPYDAAPTSTNGDAKPYTKAEISAHSNGSKDTWVRNQRNYEFVGTWGYSAVLETNASTGTIDLSDSATALTMSTAGIEIGWTLQLSSATVTEDVYVTNVTTGTAITVQRAVNGSTAASFADGYGVKHYSYPGPINEAAVIQAGRIFKRGQGAFVSEIGLPDSGEVVPIIANGLDRDVRQMIKPYTKRFI